MVGLVVLVLFVLVAVFAPLLADASGLDVTTAPGQPLEPPSSGYWLGTDKNGRSILTLLIWGSRISLVVGLPPRWSRWCSARCRAGVRPLRGWLGGVLFRITEWFLVIPFLPLAIVLATVLGPSCWVPSIVIGVTGWPSTARLIRAQTLTVESRPYVERARALGAGHWQQMNR